MKRKFKSTISIDFSTSQNWRLLIGLSIVAIDQENINLMDSESSFRIKAIICK